MTTLIVIIVTVIVVVILFIRKEDYRQFTRYYYMFVYNFDPDNFETLDIEGKQDYYELLKVIVDMIEPTIKDSTINQQIDKTSELISYFEKNYNEIIP